MSFDEDVEQRSGLAGVHPPRKSSRQLDERFLIIGKTGGAGRLALWDQNEVESARQIVLRKSKRLPQQPLDGRPHDGFADLPRNARRRTGFDRGCFRPRKRADSRRPLAVVSRRLWQSRETISSRRDRERAYRFTAWAARPNPVRSPCFPIDGLVAAGDGRRAFLQVPKRIGDGRSRRLSPHRTTQPPSPDHHHRDESQPNRHDRTP